MSNTATGPKIMGITEEVTTCECCGRSGLRRTVLLEFEDGEQVHYGTTCASRAFPKLGQGKDVADFASRLCGCGCGQFANRIIGGRKFHVACLVLA